MINLSRFSKISFTELGNLPNYYVHEIYKLYVEDYRARVKREKEEAKLKEAQARQDGRNNRMNGGDSNEIINLREMLASQGLTSTNLNDMMDELEDELS